MDRTLEQLWGWGTRVEAINTVLMCEIFLKKLVYLKSLVEGLLIHIASVVCKYNIGQGFPVANNG